MNPHPPSILITVDLEDWFQVENLKPGISHSEWSQKDWRLVRNTHRLLDLFDRFGVKATFFILGWNAEKAPTLIKEIHRRGHEIASHGYDHRLSQELTEKEFRKDFLLNKAILEDITAQPVLGYRAPSFSISDSVIKILEEAGFLYDSSYNSFSLNKRHGSLDLPEIDSDGGAFQLPDNLWELPVSNFQLGRLPLPWGGGAYFRLIPWFVFRRGIKKILAQQGAYIFYLHPWEIDPQQPGVRNLPLCNKLRHYYGLRNCYHKLERFLETYSTCRFITCAQHIFELTTADELKKRAQHVL